MDRIPSEKHRMTFCVEFGVIDLNIAITLQNFSTVFAPLVDTFDQIFEATEVNPTNNFCIILGLD